MSPEFNDGRYAVPLELVFGFQRDLAGVSPQKIFELPDLSTLINHEGKYTRPNIDIPLGMSVDSSVLSDFGAENSFDVESQNFFYKPPHRLGREDSHNKVFFGLLLARSDVERDAVGFDVAVKSKPSDRVKALVGELAMFQYMHTLNIPTFRPYALLRSKDSIHLLTLTQQSVDTMDTILWHKLDLEERWEQLDCAVKTLATLHQHMLFHGDAKFKNIGSGETGDIVVPDPELMVSTSALARTYATSKSEADRRDALTRIKMCMGADFTNITTSMEEQFFRGLPDGQKPSSPRALFKELKRHLYNPYRTEIYESNSPFKQVLLVAFDLMLHDRKEQYRA